MKTDDASAARCDLALARAVLYRFACRCFRHPSLAFVAEWSSSIAGILEAARSCSELDRPSSALSEAVKSLLAFEIEGLDIAAEHARVLGHTPRAAAVPYETEWSGAAGDLLQYHQIADICAFYSAFGLELGQACDERADHVSVELEFLHFLCVKEAWAEEQGISDLAVLCRETQRKFLAEHVATWTPGLCARLEAASRSGFYGRAAALLRVWIEDECRRLGAIPGETVLEPTATSFRPEDACISCGHATSCLGEMREALSHVDDPVRT